MPSDKSLTSLKRIKDPILQGNDFRLSETSQSLKDLTDQKYTLLNEVKKLSKIYFSLKEGKEKLNTDIIGFQTDRVQILDDLAREVNLELDEETRKLKERSTNLDFRQKTLDEKESQAQIVEADNTRLSLTLIDKIEENEKLTKDTSKLKSKLDKESNELKETLKNAKDKEFTIVSKEQRITEILDSVEKGEKTKQLLWDKKNNDLELERLEIKSTKSYLKEKEKKLKALDRELGTRRRLIEKAESRNGII